MPMIRINAIGTDPVLHRGQGSWRTALERTDTGTGPVIVMIHGYKYLPDDPDNCPHRHILALQPDAEHHKSPSWPRHMGFNAGHKDEGLAIAFGWHARGALWTAKRRAIEAGQALAQVLAQLHRQNPARPVHLMAHSMGVELCAEALHHLPAGAVQRIIAMSGAVYHDRVVRALATPAGLKAELINITSRENDVFEAMYEWLITPPVRRDRAIGLHVDAPNALTLQIDCATTLECLNRLGQPLAQSARRVCHWSSYTRQGALPLYRTLLRQPERFPLDLLRRGLPEIPSGRWSRLIARPNLPGLMPMAQKA
ncbi:MAG: alpha/beta hydrolase [Paracoccaceae bacterium]